MFLPTSCPVCGARGPAPCERCAAGLRPAPSLPAPPGVDGCWAFLSYDGPGRELVARLKYRNARSSVPFLARGMAALVDGEIDTPGATPGIDTPGATPGIDTPGATPGIDIPGATPGIDIVTWAPTTPARRRARGFDQAQVLARAVARRLGVPCRPLLRREPGPAQTGRDAAARHAGPAFSCPRPVAGRRVLLVDDVVTTGATVGAAARALRGAGAAAVHVAAAARTPPSRGRVHSAMPATRSQRWT